MRRRGLVLLLLLCISTSLLAQKVFNSQEFGFSMLEPEGWVKITDRSLDYNIRGQHGYHVISFSKNDPNTYKGLNPMVSISAGVNWRSFDETSRIMMKERALIRGEALSNFKLTRKPEIISFQNLKAIYRLEYYTLKASRKTKFNIRRKSYIVPSGKYLFYIDFIDGQENEDQTKLFEKLIESIKFDVN